MEPPLKRRRKTATTTAQEKTARGRELKRHSFCLGILLHFVALAGDLVRTGRVVGLVRAGTHLTLNGDVGADTAFAEAGEGRTRMGASVVRLGAPPALRG